MSDYLVTDAELRLTVARVLEVAYSKNDGFTSDLVLSGEGFRLSVDEQGRARLSGGAGPLVFSASDAIDRLGVEIRRISVSFSANDQGEMGFSGRFDFPSGPSLAVRGRLDIEKFMTSCSGMVCRAARALKGRRNHIDRQLKEALGEK